MGHITLILQGYIPVTHNDWRSAYCVFVCVRVCVCVCGGGGGGGGGGAGGVKICT